MKYIWTKRQKEVIKNDDRMNAPFNKVAKKVDNLEQAIENLSIDSHETIAFTKKLQELHDKIDSIYSLLEVLSDRLNKLKYFESPNPHGDDDFAKPK